MRKSEPKYKFNGYKCTFLGSYNVAAGDGSVVEYDLYHSAACSDHPCVLKVSSDNPSRVPSHLTVAGIPDDALSAAYSRALSMGLNCTVIGNGGQHHNDLDGDGTGKLFGDADELMGMLDMMQSIGSMGGPEDITPQLRELEASQNETCKVIMGVMQELPMLARIMLMKEFTLADASLLGKIRGHVVKSALALMFMRLGAGVLLQYMAKYADPKPSDGCRVTPSAN